MPFGVARASRDAATRRQENAIFRRGPFSKLISVCCEEKTTKYVAMRSNALNSFFFPLHFSLDLNTAV